MKLCWGWPAAGGLCRRSIEGLPVLCGGSSGLCCRNYWCGFVQRVRFDSDSASGEAGPDEKIFLALLMLAAVARAYVFGASYAGVSAAQTVTEGWQKAAGANGV